MFKFSVISYKSTILRVHQSVSLKYLGFSDQHVKGKLDTVIDTGYLTKFYTESHCPRNESITHLCTIFDWKGVLVSVLSIQKWCPLKSRFSSSASLQTALNALSLSFSFFITVWIRIKKKQDAFSAFCFLILPFGSFSQPFKYIFNIKIAWSLPSNIPETLDTPFGRSQLPYTLLS